MNNYADRLTELVLRSSDRDAERDDTHANTKPKDAATLILIDRSESSPKVLLGRRHHGHKFMPGKFVFPGGRVETLDRHMPVATKLRSAVEASLMRSVERPSRAKAQGYALAAIRETFEETGLLLGRKLAAAPATPGSSWEGYATQGFHP